MDAFGRSFKLLRSFKGIFVICKMLGIYPHQYRTFVRTLHLKESRLGSGFVFVTMIIIAFGYNLMVYNFITDDAIREQQSSVLASLTGSLLTYISLLTMMVDQCMAVRNQRRLIAIFDRLQAMDERLYRLHIIINNGIIEMTIRWLIALAIACEILITLLTIFFQLNITEYKSLLWIFTSVPRLYSTFDKIWLAALLMALQQRFGQINATLEKITNVYENIHNRMDEQSQLNDGNVIKYLPLPMRTNIDVTQKRSMRQIVFRNRIRPMIFSTTDKGAKKSQDLKLSSMNSRSFVTIDFKTTNEIASQMMYLCQEHEEICNIGKLLNSIWRYPLLLMMGYSFLIVTTQLYFLYCSIQEQVSNMHRNR